MFTPIKYRKIKFSKNKHSNLSPAYTPHLKSTEHYTRHIGTEHTLTLRDNFVYIAWLIVITKNKLERLVKTRQAF